MKTRRESAIAFASASVFVLAAACTKLEAGAAPVVPDNLRVPQTQTLLLEARAAGVQIYECKPGKDVATRYEYVLRAPEADLFDASGRKIGTHYAGPTWEANDGSKAVGEIKALAEATDINAIPWLLLNVKARSDAGLLARASSVQRVQTAGGKAPAQGCSAEQAGKELRVPYTAMYFIYAASDEYQSY